MNTDYSAETNNTSWPLVIQYVSFICFGFMQLRVTKYVRTFHHVFFTLFFIITFNWYSLKTRLSLDSTVDMCAYSSSYSRGGIPEAHFLSRFEHKLESFRLNLFFSVLQNAIHEQTQVFLFGWFFGMVGFPWKELQEFHLWIVNRWKMTEIEVY
jgi:hypothetical protein